MSHIEGVDRNQSTLFPESLDRYITDENVVRFIDVFVSELDLGGLGFSKVTSKETGRPPYHPGDLLRLYIYGYLNKLHSSRSLERETERNVELMWLIRKLRPDFKTIANFRRDNSEAIRGVCREFTLICKKLELFSGQLLAVDGSKFRAVNSRQKNFSKKRLEKSLKEIDEKVDKYLEELDVQDALEAEEKKLSADELREKIKRLKEAKGNYKNLLKSLNSSGERQISLTDPESRSMKSGAGCQVSYNVQVAVDEKHKLIVAHEVTNSVTDYGQLSGISIKAKELLGVEKFNVVADRGYYDSEDIKACLAENITPFVPKSKTSANRKHGLYPKEAFTYNKKKDIFICPGNEKLTRRTTAISKGRYYYYYETNACQQCKLKPKCTRSSGNRRVSRVVSGDALEDMLLRVLRNPELMKKRQSIVEHPFGTIKGWMRHRQFLTRGKKHVGAEMALSVLSYNLKRVVNIIGVRQMIAAVA